MSDEEVDHRVVTRRLPYAPDLSGVCGRPQVARWPAPDSRRPAATKTSTDPVQAPQAASRRCPPHTAPRPARSSNHGVYGPATGRICEQLAELLHATCLRDCAAITAATDALVTADPERSHAAIGLGGEAEAMAHHAEREAIRLLTLQAPVAGELRQVVTAIQLTANLQRMAGYWPPASPPPPVAPPTRSSRTDPTLDLPHGRHRHRDRHQRRRPSSTYPTTTTPPPRSMRKTTP